MDRLIHKAKRKDNGEWIKGFLFKQIAVEDRMYFAIEVIEETVKSYEIDESTICEFTGLLDKNRTEIWTNDIVRIRYKNLEDSYCKVLFRAGAFVGETEDGDELNISSSTYQEVEVLGNIFDNPKMMQEYAGPKEEIVPESNRKVLQFPTLTSEEVARTLKFAAIAKKHGTVGRAIESCAEYEEIGTSDEFRALKKTNEKVNEIINRQLIAGKDNYKEVYGCFYEIVRIMQGSASVPYDTHISAQEKELSRADRIRNMNDEELADWILSHDDKTEACGRLKREDILKWLYAKH